jgi:Lactate dehydrogenase and related dehydrogenases
VIVVRKEHIDAANGGQVKLIIGGGVGVDNIDVDYAKANGIDVKNTPRASSQSVAELAMGHMFACARYLSIAGHTMREGEWEKKAYGKGIELQGKTLGIVGFGRIGQHLGVMANAIGMKVIAFDIYQVPVISEQLGIPYVEMDELLAQSDFISVHAPAVDGGALISAENIAEMKDGVVIIKTSRGSNVNEDALLAGLESGKVRAAGLDVYADESVSNVALYSHPMVSCSPQIGAATVEAQKRIGQEIVEIVAAV